MCEFFIADKRFSANNNLQQTSPVSEKRSPISASKKSTSVSSASKQHVNQTTVPLANKTSHAKGERSLSISFLTHPRSIYIQWIVVTKICAKKVTFNDLKFHRIFLLQFFYRDGEKKSLSIVSKSVLFRSRSLKWPYLVRPFFD